MENNWRLLVLFHQKHYNIRANGQRNPFSSVFSHRFQSSNVSSHFHNALYCNKLSFFIPFLLSINEFVIQYIYIKWVCVLAEMTKSYTDYDYSHILYTIVGYLCVCDIISIGRRRYNSLLLYFTSNRVFLVLPAFRNAVAFHLFFF